MRGNLNSFFKPKTIAIIGASNSEGKVGNIFMKKLKNFKGKVIPINKNDSVVEGKTAYKKISDYKKRIDLAVIATPKETVKKLLKQIIKKGVKNVIIISAGYSEIGNKKDEEWISEFSKKNEMNILGPNCFGIINTERNLDTTFSKEMPKKGSTVFITQSGALSSYIMDLEIPLRGVISVGNMADLDFCDFVEFFNHDKKTKRIILYIERLKDGRKFLDICKNSKKEIIAVKSGKTEKGKEATMSHTGSLATDINIYKGAFKQAKIKYSDSLLHAFSIKKQDYISSLKGKNIAIITNAGGAGALLTDELEEKGFSVYGPKDILGTATSIDYKKALHKITKEFDNILVVLTPQTMSDPLNTAKIILESRWKDKIVAIFLGNKSMKNAVKILKENNIPVFTNCV